MVRLPEFRAGDLVITCGSETSGIRNGLIGIVTGVEMISREHFIYWVRFSKKKIDTPMWETEIELLENKK